MLFLNKDSNIAHVIISDVVEPSVDYMKDEIFNLSRIVREHEIKLYLKDI